MDQELQAVIDLSTVRTTVGKTSEVSVQRIQTWTFTHGVHHLGNMQTTPAAEGVARLGAHARLRRRLPSPELRRAIRANAGVTTTEVAEAVGVTRQAVSSWERGTRSPQGGTLRAYLEVLDELQRVLA
jgi:DNA-binding transcriptional regulator YiaG